MAYETERPVDTSSTTMLAVIVGGLAILLLALWAFGAFDRTATTPTTTDTGTTSTITTPSDATPAPITPSDTNPNPTPTTPQQ